MFLPRISDFQSNVFSELWFSMSSTDDGITETSNEKLQDWLDPYNWLMIKVDCPNWFHWIPIEGGLFAETQTISPQIVMPAGGNS